MNQVKHTLCLLLAVGLLASLADAQVRRNSMEARQNQQAMSANKAQLDRDEKELKEFTAKLTQFEMAFRTKNVAQVADLKKRLLLDMQREIQQSENKIAQDRREVSQSQSEKAASSRELNRSRYDRATPDRDKGDARDVRDDRRDKKGDRRDVADDRNDLSRQIARTNRQKEIYTKLQAFTFSFEPSVQEKAIAYKALLQEFSATMEKDIVATKAEIQEDKVEALEDSRERREDKREVRERRRNW
ncbi:MAG: hypothetical protein AAFR59_11020 [Bacteroidota bacterium]